MTVKNKIQQFTQSDVEVIEKEPLYLGFFKMLRYRFRHKLFAGGWSKVIEREIFERGHAVAVLPYDPIRNEFVVIEQLRIGAAVTSETPWLLECIAGMIDKDEAPEQVCRREAQEEAGLTILNLTKAMSYMSSPGGTTERLHVYIGEVDSSSAGGIHGLDEEEEDILVHRISEAQMMNWLNDGRIDNAATVIAVQWFAMNKEKLINEWNS